jgi:hypothetical protein
MLYAAIEKDEELSTPSVVYAELVPQFRGNVNFLQQFLREHKIDVLPLDIESVTIAAMPGWNTSRERRGPGARNAATNWNEKNICFPIFTSPALLWPNVTPF